MISAAEREAAVKRAAEMIERAGVPLRAGEGAAIEAADFGLGRLLLEGAEILTIAESPRIVVKVIVLFPGQTLPEHWHPPLGDDPGKEETIRAIWGSFAVFTPGLSDTPVSTAPHGKQQLYTARRAHLLRPGEQLHLPPGTKHWFQGGSEGGVAWSFTSTARDALDQFTDPHVVRRTVVQG
jgi:D-lyxose ketol-isomerase